MASAYRIGESYRETERIWMKWNSRSDVETIQVVRSDKQQMHWISIYSQVAYADL